MFGFRRIGVLILLLCSAFTAYAQPPKGENAIPAPHVLDIASGFPEGALMTFGMRLDDDFITELDALTTYVGGRGTPLPSELLNEIDFLGEGFDITLRSWLGDRAAVAVYNVNLFNGGFGFLFAAEISDRYSAEVVFNAVASELNATITEENGVTRYDFELNSQDAAGLQPRMQIMLTDETVYIGSASRMPDATRPTLGEDTTFTETMALLPEDQYNFAFYLDGQRLIDLSLFATAFADDVPLDTEQLRTLQDGLGGVVMAGTILDGDTLAIDFAQTRIDPEMLAGFGIESELIAPLRYKFAEQFPANTALMLHSNDVPALITGVGKFLELQEQFTTAPFSLNAILNEQIEQTGVFLDLATVLQTEVDPSINRDVVLWVGYDDSGASAVSHPLSPIEFAIVTDVQGGDPQVLQARFEAVEVIAPDALETLLEGALSMRLQVSTARETINGREAILVYTDELFELIVTLDQDCYIVGTRGVVTGLLTEDTETLADNLRYTDAQARLFLPNATSYGYVDYPVIFAALDTAGAFLGTPDAPTRAEYIESATISTARDAEGNAFVRLTITFMER